ncbi:Uncharacterised protein [[Eubacterium] contortum]|uniref:Uncharacterized protein n=1 Tax=Faecalicatena contorta TaxID=39482 RepID=A0A173YML9_9FIRM|nr:Uncharacterised protein [[Eubacterium] contortum] [Faecalicatena contorta]
MTSKERVLCAVNHKPVDRIPLDLGGDCLQHGRQGLL